MSKSFKSKIKSKGAGKKMPSLRQPKPGKMPRMKPGKNTLDGIGKDVGGSK
jgi:hypothetical protein